jgi:disulfide bond formation protein DsbB
VSFDALSQHQHRTTGATRIALVTAALALATIVGAWGFEWAGYAPCELCLKERIPYYAGIPLALVVAAIAHRGRAALSATGFIALALIFGAGAILAAYHAGIEWKFWPGPASCTGSFAPPSDVQDFFNQLKTATAVRCDAAALRILGLSLAGWDCLVCLVLTTFAVVGATRASRP